MNHATSKAEFQLLESATAQPLDEEATSIAALAKNRDIPLPRRLEAYEDLIDSEVGDTQLSRARNIERCEGLRQLYLKFEGGNPTGTQKDRIAFAQAMDALRRGYDAVTLATCGNYGAAMALAASSAGLDCLVMVPEGFHTRRIQEIENLGGRILRTSGGYEEAVARSRDLALRDELYDANPGGDNTTIQLAAYAQIAHEIYDELRDAPAVVAVSVSNGTTLAGIYRGFVSLYRRGKTSRMPRMIAGSSFNKNPIIRAFKQGLSLCDDLPPQVIRETQVNEPLVNWHSIDGDLALSALRETNGWVGHASDRALTRLSKNLREREGMMTLPAATAGLHALLAKQQEKPLPGDRYVAVITGRRA